MALTKFRTSEENVNSGSYSASELRSQQVSLRSDSQFDGENFCCIEIYDTFERLKKCLTVVFELYYEQLSEFERGHIIELKMGGWAIRRIADNMGRSNAANRRCWQEWVDSSRFKRHDDSGHPRATVDQEERLIVRSAVPALDSSLSTIRKSQNLLEKAHASKDAGLTLPAEGLSKTRKYPLVRISPSTTAILITRTSSELTGLG
ncbi:uncharacterized protein TNCV_2502661 [Trichonephila clavipes]|nr:uncharacterized protein TNCV_2502661 [Trichonephila clavipes]